MGLGNVLKLGGENKMVGFKRVIKRLDVKVVTQRKKFVSNVGRFKREKKALQIKRVQARKQKTLFAIRHNKIGRNIGGVKR